MGDGANKEDISRCLSLLDSNFLSTLTTTFCYYCCYTISPVQLPGAVLEILVEGKQVRYVIALNDSLRRHGRAAQDFLISAVSPA